MYLSIINDAFQGLIMGNRRVLPLALKDTCVHVPVKKEQRRSSGRDDTVVPRCFRRMLRHYPFRIVYANTRPRESRRRRRRRYARTHTRASTAGRAVQCSAAQRATPVQPESKHHRSKPAQRAARRGAARLIRAGSHGHVHASAGTRAESQSRSPGSRWAL